MVVFVCNGCGDTLKRTAVSQHFHKCRRCVFVSCLDCNEDFYNDTYKSHLKCITEVEKYSAKDYIPKVAKGEAKQDDWMQRVLKSLNESNHPQHLREPLEQLKSYTNIPKKKSKFVNFVKNCLKLKSDSRINEIWNIINRIKPEVKTEDEPVKRQEETGSITAESSKDENTPTESSIRDSDTSSKQDNWINNVRQCLKTAPPSSDLSSFIDVLRAADDIPRKPKHFAKYADEKFGLRNAKTIQRLWQLITRSEAENGDMQMDETKTEAEDLESGAEPDRPNKRKRKEQRSEAQTKKQKKDKQRAAKIGGNKHPGVTKDDQENDVEQAKETRKRKSPVNDDAEMKLSKKHEERGETNGIEDDKNDNDYVEEKIDEVKIHPKKFDWKGFIKAKVSANKNQTIKLARLKKQAIEECLNVCTMVDSHESLDKLFSKALHRTPGLRMDADRVTLAEVTV